MKFLFLEIIIVVNLELEIKKKKLGFQKTEIKNIKNVFCG